MPGYPIATLRPPAAFFPKRLGTLTAPARVGRAYIGRHVGWYLRLHLLCLMLYAFFGKGFAYVGTRFFYVSEALLALGLVALITSRALPKLFHTSIGVVMVPFFLWESFCAFPYITEYGINVARDAMVWGYAVFGWIIAALIASSPNLLDRLLKRYRRFVPWFFLFGPLAALVTVFFATRMPTWPGTDVPFVSIKFDEFEAHLAGVAAFVITGLNPSSWWLALVGLEVLIGAPNRGGLVGFFLAFLVAGILARRPRALLLPAIMLVVLFFAAALNVHVSVPGGSRDFSAAQIFDGLGSTVSSDVDTEDLQNTRDWRLNWWQKIWDYTVVGPYFWTGKGYGINLAVDDGFQDAEELLRSPHNSHLTFLARSGVPGFLLWITLQLTWLTTMLLSFFRARQSGKLRWAALFAWIISYWVAFVTAASFDVFLENPMAAVPFWTIFGLGWGSQIVFSRYWAAA